MTGHLDDAYRLLLQRECPSWLYSVSMGATTIWERWDSMLPDGTINPGQMTSFNHYALGAIADWMHRVIGGITPAEPGYRTVRIAPRPGGGLTWAETSLDTPHGQVAVVWRLSPDGVLDVDVTVPDGITAEIDLVGMQPHRVGGGRPQISVDTAEATKDAVKTHGLRQTY
jgi:alpha-L-rhamnosidase